MDTQELLKKLPHGSGINGNWYIEEKEGKFTASNFYEPTNEAGFYDGIAYFTLHIPKVNPNDFKLHYNDKISQYYNRKYQLREYLEDTIAFCLS